MGRNLFTVLYVLVTVICVSISVYLSYWGYYSHLQELTILFAVLIGLLLFGVDMVIRLKWVAQKSILAPIFFFILVATFSGASNFNFLYTNFMSYDIAERAVRDQFETFRTDLTETRTVLISQPVVSDVESSRAELERELDNLYEQLNDPLRPGCGERCRGHVENISEMLGGPPTDIAIPSPGSSADVNEEWYDNYRSIVFTNFEQQANASAYASIRSRVNRIDSLLNEYDDPDQALSRELREAGNTLLRGEGLRVSAEMRRESLDIQREANSILPPDSQVNHARIESDLDKVGEIPVSFHDAFIERPNLGVTTVSLLLGVFVDVVPVLFALVLVGAGMNPPSDVSARRPRKTGRVAT